MKLQADFGEASAMYRALCLGFALPNCPIGLLRLGLTSQFELATLVNKIDVEIG